MIPRDCCVRLGAGEYERGQLAPPPASRDHVELELEPGHIVQARVAAATFIAGLVGSGTPGLDPHRDPALEAELVDWVFDHCVEHRAAIPLVMVGTCWTDPEELEAVRLAGPMRSARRASFDQAAAALRDGEHSVVAAGFLLVAQMPPAYAGRLTPQPR